MPYTMPRRGARGTRYTAMYRSAEGRDRSAGTYASEAEALEVAVKKEEWERGPREAQDPQRRATMTVAEYAPVFLRAHTASATTVRGYESALRTHVVPVMGNVRLRDLEREQLRHWLKRMERNGVSPTSIRHVKMAFSALLTTAMDDGYVDRNAVRGLKSARITRGKIAVMTPDQFKRVHDALPTEGAQLLAYLIVNSGMRQGEATALRLRDVDPKRNMLVIDKALTEPGKNHHPQGMRFLMKPYPKDFEARSVALKPRVVNKVHDYAQKYNIDPDDLLFPGRLVKRPTKGTFPKAKPDIEIPSDLGVVYANNGRPYPHCSMGAYTTARCRCEYCKQWMRNYNRERKRNKSGETASSRKSLVEPLVPAATDENPMDYIGRHEIGAYWPAAVKAADLPIEPVAYQLRHTHAQWLYEAGWALTDVAKRLGHNDLRMVDRYVQVSDDALGALLDETPDLLDF